VSASCLPSWSNWLTGASSVTMSLLMTSKSGATFVAPDSWIFLKTLRSLRTFL
jgi:hypothetical protein